jgi:hypothetical protein
VVISEVTAAGFVSVSVTTDWSLGTGFGDLFLLVFEKPKGTASTDSTGRVVAPLTK